MRKMVSISIAALGGLFRTARLLVAVCARQKGRHAMNTARDSATNLNDPHSDSATDLNDPHVHSVRDWIARRIDGTMPRWQVSDENPVAEKGETLEINTPEGTDSIRIADIKHVIFRPLLRVGGYADLLIRTVKNGEPTVIYEGTFRGESLPLLNAISVFKKANLM
jgi:hypothetical protein